MIEHDAIPAYAASLPSKAPAADPDAHLVAGSREDRAAFWLTLDAINFGSGWFPTLRKADGSTGYGTVSGGLRRRFDTSGPWPADELATIGLAELAVERVGICLELGGERVQRRHHMDGSE